MTGLSSTEGEAGAPRSVLFLAPSAYPLGGVAVWLDHLVADLRAAGWPVEVALLEGSHHDVDAYLEAHPRLGDVRRVSAPTATEEGRVRALARLFLEARADVAVTVNVADAEEAFWRARQRGAGGRLVVTQHALAQDFFDHLRDLARAVDSVVVTNRLSAAVARRWSGVPDERIAYAPYGVPIGEAAPLTAAGGRLRIAWAGRMDEAQKGALDLPGICRALDRRGVAFELLVAGDGPVADALREALGPWIETGRASWLGRLTNAEVCERVLARSSVLLLTSSWETGPIVGWEAGAAGLALVTARFLGSGLEGALVEGENALFFERGDTEGAAARLEEVAAPERRRELGIALHRTVQRRYSLEASGRAWRDALAAASARPSVGSSGRLRDRSARGRLDRWLGPALGESTREVLGVRRAQSSAGAEWPHAYGGSSRPEFERLLRELDGAAAARGVESR